MVNFTPLVQVGMAARLKLSEAEEEISSLKRKIAKLESELATVRSNQRTGEHPMIKAEKFDQEHSSSDAFRTKTGVPHEVFVELFELLEERFRSLKMGGVFQLSRQDLYLILNKLRSDAPWRDLQVEYGMVHSRLSHE